MLRNLIVRLRCAAWGHRWFGSGEPLPGIEMCRRCGERRLSFSAMMQAGALDKTLEARYGLKPRTRPGVSLA